ncbi:MAG: beta strand repeat-containing protein, partial [Bacteroidia bacterium]
WYGSTFTDIMTVTGSNRVGINVAQNPLSIFDVNGDIAMREGTAITAANGANNDIVLPLNATYGGEHSHYRITGPAAAFSLTGIAGGNNGQVVTLINASTQTMTIANANAGSVAANRIQTGTSADINIVTGGSVSMIYNPTISRWVVTASAGLVGNDWTLVGNAGTNPANNFLGTTDNQHLIFRTNNTEKARISSVGTLGMGTSVVGTNFVDPFSKVEVLGDGVYGDFLMHTSSNTAWGNWITNFRSRGAHNAPTIVQNGDEIAMYNAYAYDGTKYGDPNFFQHAAYISMNIDGTPGVNDLPTRIAFATTADGALTATERMRITNAGNIGINTGVPSATDRVNIVSGTTMNGMLLTSQQTTAGSYGFRNNATFAAGSSTVYTGYNGTVAIAGGTSTNAAVFADVANGTAPAGVFSTNGTGTSAALIGTSTVWNGANTRTSLASAISLVGINTAASGTSTGHGIYGLTSQRDGAGVYGYNNGPAGTGFALPRTSVYGDGIITGAYAFGIMGDGGTSLRSGAVFGDDYGLARGALGYYAFNGADYAVYGFGQGHTNGLGTGRLAGTNENAMDQPNNMIGLGIYGGVMGGWVRGMHYGMHAKGTEYGMYVDGNSITNKPTIQLMETGKETRAISFAPSAMSADVYTRGNITLRNGTAFVAFPQDFSLSISAEVPLNVTVTPTGNSKGVYVTEVTSKGFRIVENENGTSSVSVNWVAYGTRAGYENPQEMVSPEILSADFDKNMDAVMYNDNNTEGQAKGIWFDGEKVQTGEMPASFHAAKMAKVRTRQIPNADVTNPNPPRELRQNVSTIPSQIGVSDMPLEQTMPQQRRELLNEEKVNKGGKTLDK